jgi:hypothetical protein
MKWLYHKLMYHYYGCRICLYVQYVRVYNLCRGKSPLWEYTWRQIACGAIAAKIRNDRNAGLEPSGKTIELLRNVEQDYNVGKSSI